MTREDDVKGAREFKGQVSVFITAICTELVREAVDDAGVSILLRDPEDVKMSCHAGMQRQDGVDVEVSAQARQVMTLVAAKEMLKRAIAKVDAALGEPIDAQPTYPMANGGASA
jgi:hypothetical protein